MRATSTQGRSFWPSLLRVELAHRHGAHVTALANPDLTAELSAIGADAVITDPVATSERYDLITESVGGTSLSEAIAALAPGIGESFSPCPSTAHPCRSRTDSARRWRER